MKKIILVGLAVLFFVAAMTGCAAKIYYSDLKDNLSKQLTAVDLIKVKDMVFQKTATAEFYMCKDTETELICSAQCDGANDLACPKLTLGGFGGTTSNLR
ncbi:MAG: hypothetical protein WC889_10340 [Myxococcota bacterium]|jgi:hypothetical protein